MRIPEQPWEDLRSYGNAWAATGTHGSTLKYSISYRNSWASMGIHGNAMEIQWRYNANTIGIPLDGIQSAKCGKFGQLWKYMTAVELLRQSRMQICENA